MLVDHDARDKVFQYKIYVVVPAGIPGIKSGLTE